MTITQASSWTLETLTKKDAIFYHQQKKDPSPSIFPTLTTMADTTI